MTAGKFGVVRPYEDWMREKVFEFLDSIGYTPGEGLVVAPGTADDQAAAWIDRTPIDLLLLPYHKHRSEAGPFVDGVGVAMLLSNAFVERAIPVVMPITDFSMNVSFDRRFSELREKKPQIADLIVVMPESELGSVEIAAHIRDIAGR
jgi:hypothetical protein